MLIIEQDSAQLQAPSLYLLDLFSTSQTNQAKCKNNAPFICIPPEGKPGLLIQACCNDWTCPRCGAMRAKYEYGRMVEGARTLAKDHHMYFLTITCTGTITLEESEATYLDCTNRLLTAFRLHIKRSGGFWAYAAVTERQPERRHPHSHYMTTFAPTDAFFILEDYERYKHEVKEINAQIPLEMRFSPVPEEDIQSMDMFSRWLSLAAVKVGLGVQCRISAVDQVEGVSRYLAKYLFKEMVSTTWPDGWKRVRYSQSWPKLPDKAPSDAFPVVRRADWLKVAELRGTVETSDPAIYHMALVRFCFNVRCTTPNIIDLPENIEHKPTILEHKPTLGG